jgi:hypothetical protein
VLAENHLASLRIEFARRYAMPGATKGRFVIAFLVCCLGSFVVAQAQDEKSANDSELERATETVKNITTASPDKGVPNNVLE